MLKNKGFLLIPALVATLPVLVDYNIVGSDFLLYLEIFQGWWGENADVLYRWFAAFINLATAITAYAGFEMCFRNEKVSLLGCALYVLAPYRLALMYDHSAIGEYVALLFLPLIAGGCCGLFTAQNKSRRIQGVIMAGVGLAGTIIPYALTTDIRSGAIYNTPYGTIMGVGSALALGILLWFGMVLGNCGDEERKVRTRQVRIGVFVLGAGCILAQLGGDFLAIALLCMVITVCMAGLWLDREECGVLPGKAVLYTLLVLTLVFGMYEVNQILLTGTNIR